MNKFKNKKLIKYLLLIFIITIIIYSYFNIINTNQSNTTSFTQNFQSLKEKITVKNADDELDTKATIIHKANIDYIPKISVIIPVYNTEEYLRECLNSVINQTLKEIEIICVDDGSTDSSLDILKEYAEKDKRITIIKQENQGSAAARNQGILIAKGEYIGLIDSDDKISLNYYKLLYKNARKNKSDISATSNIKRFIKQKTIYNVNAGFKNKHLISTIKDKGDIIIKTGISCNKIYNRNFLIKNNIKYLEIKNAAEDNYFTDISIITANKISVIDNAIYYYRLTPNSLTANAKKDINSFLMADIYKNIDKFILNLNISNIDKYIWLKIINKRKIIDYKDFYRIIKYEYKKDFEKYFLQNFPELYKYIKPSFTISLTSHPTKINTVHLTIESLLDRPIKANKIILQLTTEEFPNKEKDLPKQLLDLTEKGLTIKWYNEKNIRAYTKLIPALEKYLDTIIITVDNEAVYDKDMLYRLYRTYKKYSEFIIITVNGNTIYDKYKLYKLYKYYKNYPNNIHIYRTENSI